VLIWPSSSTTTAVMYSCALPVPVRFDENVSQ